MRFVLWALAAIAESRHTGCNVKPYDFGVRVKPLLLALMAVQGISETAIDAKHVARRRRRQQSRRCSG